MEKKVEDVLEILQKIFDCADLEGRYLTEKQWDILNDTVNIKEYLRKELDKARKEGYEEGVYITGYDNEDNDYTAGYSATPNDLVDWGYKAKLKDNK